MNIVMYIIAMISTTGKQLKSLRRCLFRNKIRPKCIFEYIVIVEVKCTTVKMTKLIRLRYYLDNSNI